LRFYLAVANCLTRLLSFLIEDLGIDLKLQTSNSGEGGTSNSGDRKKGGTAERRNGTI
jgi:hypothetical protein